MIKKMAFLGGLTVSLAACVHAPSPQDTAPSREAKCSALRAHILRAPMQTTTPTAVADNQNVDIRQQYHNECE